MKKLIVLIVISLSLKSLSAQKLIEGSLDFLTGEQELHLIIDYKNAIVHGRPEEAFVNKVASKQGEQWKEKWNGETKTELYQKFTLLFNRGAETLRLKAGNFPDANYVAVVKIKNIEKKGTTDADVLFSKSGSSDIIAIVSVQGKGGKYGSMENLAGDGFRRAGYNLGRFLSSSIKIERTDLSEKVETPVVSETPEKIEKSDSVIFIKPQPSEVVILKNPQKRRQLPQAVITLDAGYGWRIGKLIDDLNDFEKYYARHLLSGFVWDASFDYFIKDNFGVRLIVNQYRSSHNDLVRNLETGKQGPMDTKHNITYIGPAFVFRLPFADNSFLFTANAGMGYIEFRGKQTFLDEYFNSYGATLGFQMGAGLEYKVLPQLGIGINMLVTNGIITKFELDNNGEKSEKTFKEGVGEGLFQIKVGAGIRFYIK